MNLEADSTLVNDQCENKRVRRISNRRGSHGKGQRATPGCADHLLVERQKQTPRDGTEV